MCQSHDKTWIAIKGNLHHTVLHMGFRISLRCRLFHSTTSNVRHQNQWTVNNMSGWSRASSSFCLHCFGWPVKYMSISLSNFITKQIEDYNIHLFSSEFAKWSQILLEIYSLGLHYQILGYWDVKNMTTSPSIEINVQTKRCHDRRNKTMKVIISQYFFIVKVFQECKNSLMFSTVFVQVRLLTMSPIVYKRNITSPLLTI